jgi:hypothetical protein
MDTSGTLSCSAVTGHVPSPCFNATQERHRGGTRSLRCCSRRALKYLLSSGACELASISQASHARRCLEGAPLTNVMIHTHKSKRGGKLPAISKHFEAVRMMVHTRDRLAGSQEQHDGHVECTPVKLGKDQRTTRGIETVLSDHGCVRRQ